jgi:hypothetical protein
VAAVDTTKDLSTCTFVRPVFTKAGLLFFRGM